MLLVSPFVPVPDSTPPAPKEKMTFDPYRVVSKNKRAAFTTFMRDPLQTHHVVDFDRMKKKSFTLMYGSGEWLVDDVSITC